MGAVFKIDWGVERAGYIDILKQELFRRTVSKKPIEHLVLGDRGAVYKARCSLTVREKFADLDYTQQDQWDQAVMRLNFVRPTRDEIQSVQWKWKNASSFSKQEVVEISKSDDSDPFAQRDDMGGEEGELYLLTAKVRKRLHHLASKKKKEADSLACEVCGFDFEHTYGVIGEGFCEVHHLRPISEGIQNTKMADLAIICSNCHRMIHRKKTLSISALKAMVDAKSSGGD